MMDDLLKSFGLSWEDLDTPGHSGERELLMQQLEALRQNGITVEGIRNYIIAMRSTLEKELIKTPETEKVWLFFERPSRVALVLKARLQNCMELEEFLSGEQRARSAIEKSVANIKKSKVTY